MRSRFARAYSWALLGVVGSGVCVALLWVTVPPRPEFEITFGCGQIWQPFGCIENFHATVARWSVMIWVAVVLLVLAAGVIRVASRLLRQTVSASR